MKNINVCLDLVLKALADNEDLLCYYEVDSEQDFLEGKYHLSGPYQKLCNDLGLNNDDFTQLLKILKENEYVDYVIEKFSGTEVNVKVMYKNTTGTMTHIGIVSVNDEAFGRPTNIKLLLKGKFFILNEGGYTQKHKKQARETLLQTLAIWITAIGTGIGGLYLLIKAIIWLSENFYF